ncbi:hypothetical protein LA76x_2935 [Lysobacter antibioticus]|uniref:Uncharacterized protein n=1 Tax=Lysobacter antibioticus TaxID=84531 RepID=A0A0S2FBZ7_LYSAN|nr:hypothetical protein LA76x_2935 [Lysobacter antibioticus]
MTRHAVLLRGERPQGPSRKGVQPAKADASAARGGGRKGIDPRRCRPSARPLASGSAEPANHAANRVGPASGPHGGGWCADERRVRAWLARR